MNFDSFDTLVIDFNGTILDDRELCVTILNEMLVMQGHEPVTLDKYLHIFTFPIIEYYRRAGFKLEPEGNENFDYLAKIFVRSFKERFPGLQIFDDAIPFLESFKGKKKLILLSASEQKALESQLEHFGVLSYFDVVLGIKDIYAASKLNEAKRYFKENKTDMSKVLFIGDTLHDEEVAKALGAKSIFVSRGHQHPDVLKSLGESEIFPDLMSLVK